MQIHHNDGLVVVFSDIGQFSNDIDRSLLAHVMLVVCGEPIGSQIHHQFLNGRISISNIFLCHELA